MILHKLNSTSQKALDDLSNMINQEDGIILIEDAVYLPYFHKNQLEPFNKHVIYVLENDIQIRGIDTLSNKDLKLINYNEFVELCTQYKKVVSWFE